MKPSWLNQRAAGVLLHPSSLPSAQGIGSFGEAAYRLIDFLNASKLKYWQVCPMGPTGYGYSPYQCFSAFAGNPYFIDLEQLVKKGILCGHDLTELQQLPQEKVDFGALYEQFWPILKKAFVNFKKNPKKLSDYGDFEKFKKKEAYWLHSYACFKACKEYFRGLPWYEWPKHYRSFSEAQRRPLFLLDELTEAIEAQKFSQYLFFAQWRHLKEYAQSRSVEIIGDIPIFIALDSADVWTNPELFQLNSSGLPSQVAGVPPDYFSPTGQLWGNPLYDWKNNFNAVTQWWIKRVKLNLRFYDVLRLDHFRGFESYWSVPANAKDAQSGKWVKGPGKALFDAIEEAVPSIKWIAEDLGDITPSVHELRASLGLPGMAILQFAFNNDPSNAYLPHNLDPHSVLYPGTHDNDTAWGWYNSTGRENRNQFRNYFRIPGDAVPWDMIRAAYQSVSRLIIIPMQDLLNKDKEARMNYPGIEQGNWTWRYSNEEFEHLKLESAHYLEELANWYYR